MSILARLRTQTPLGTQAQKEERFNQCCNNQKPSAQEQAGGDLVSPPPSPEAVMMYTGDHWRCEAVRVDQGHTAIGWIRTAQKPGLFASKYNTPQHYTGGLVIGWWRRSRGSVRVYSFVFILFAWSKQTEPLGWCLFINYHPVSPLIISTYFRIKLEVYTYGKVCNICH